MNAVNDIESLASTESSNLLLSLNDKVSSIVAASGGRSFLIKAAIVS